jgi:hypothetical protein
MPQWEEEAMVQRERYRGERSVQGGYLMEAGVLPSQKGTHQKEKGSRKEPTT